VSEQNAKSGGLSATTTSTDMWFLVGLALFFLGFITSIVAQTILEYLDE
jgi:nucleoside recognition membrane protein YjiH